MRSVDTGVLGAASPVCMTDCVIRGTPSGNGYRELRRDGRQQYAHRLAWEDAHGPIPAGMKVLHHCDNPPCSNVDHLFLGTQADNMADMKAKGRGNGPRKLTAEQVAEARARVAAGERQRDVAQLLGCTQSNISRIVTGDSWKGR